MNAWAVELVGEWIVFLEIGVLCGKRVLIVVGFSCLVVVVVIRAVRRVAWTAESLAAGGH